jgi:hypothetical protein
LSKKEISTLLGQKAISGQLNEVIGKLLNDKLIEWAIKDKPNSSRQKHLINQRGIVFIQLLEQRK